MKLKQCGAMFAGVVFFAISMLAGAVAAPTTPAAPITIPFSLHKGNIVVAVRLGTRAALPFIFDSGLSHGNILTAQTASKLGLKSTAHVHLGDASGKGHTGGLTRIDTVHVGKAKFTRQPFAIVKVPPQIVARRGKAPIAGFIGAPFLSHAVVCIDYPQRVIQRWPRSGFDHSAYDAVQARVNHGLLTIHAIIDGLPALLAVDTGNNGGIELFPSFVQPHKLLKKYPHLHPMEGASGAGNQFHILAGTAKMVAFGPHTELKNASLMFIAQSFNPAWGIDGLVGYKALSQLNPCMDRSGGHVYWPTAKVGH